ncbi:radical SAM protein [Streptomyces hirsutus]|uniref:radical SAM protein n=1 Tax=Streptomyces hirsutus TaxID=35620 RepID=UPI00342EED46
MSGHPVSTGAGHLPAAAGRTAVRRQRHDAGERPFIVIWESTRACPLACLHCRAEAVPDRDPRELDTAAACDLLRQVAAFGQPAPLFVITGGDPFQRPDLTELIAYGRESGVRVAVSPSGTPTLTEERLRELHAAGAAGLSLSLDGSTAVLHDDFRGVPGVFRWTLDAWDAARALGMKVQINTTVTRHNLHDLPAVVRLVADHGAMLWSEHFAVAMLHAELPDRRWSDVRPAGVNLGVVGVLAGVWADLPALTGAGCALLVGAIGAHLVVLVRLGRGALGGRLAPVVGYYRAAAAALIVGAVLGWLLATGRAGPQHHGELRLAHVHVTLLGWIGLPVLGTLFMLWPTALGVRMSERTTRSARHVLGLTGGGLLTAVAALAAGLRPAAAFGVALYAAGVAVAAVLFARTVRLRPAVSAAAAWALAAAPAWLFAGVVADLGLLVTRSVTEAQEPVASLLPVLLVGLVGQILMGALTYLLPVVLASGPKELGPVPGDPAAGPATARRGGQGPLHRRGRPPVRDADRGTLPARAAGHRMGHDLAQGRHLGFPRRARIRPYPRGQTRPVRRRDARRGGTRDRHSKARTELARALAVVALAGSLGVVLLATALPAT